MDLASRKVLIVGLGQSGLAAARLCLKKGAKVHATDTRSLGELSEEARALPIELSVGGHEKAPFARADTIIVSPGVPQLPEIQAAEARGVEVIGELELAWRFCKQPVLAVGGTNGKSTTTTLLARLLEAGGLSTFAGGNLGEPLSQAVDGRYDVLVVEVSSFQLERAPTFRPAVSILLNVTDDHLDRYPSFAAYADAKGNAFVNQRTSDVAIVPAADEVCLAQARRGQGTVLTFGLSPQATDYRVEAGRVLEVSSGIGFDLGGSDLYGTHNWLNAAAAVAAARAQGIGEVEIAAGLGRFRALGHRMALAGEADGVRYYDDSKGTNVGAAVTALLGLPEKRVVLIAGGRDKQGSYEPLARALAGKGRAVVVIGEAADRIAEALAGVVPVRRAPSMDAAVRDAAKLAEPGDAVLLSPACSSFDMFTGYAARGDAFVAAVKKLAAGPLAPGGTL